MTEPVLGVILTDQGNALLTQSLADSTPVLIDEIGVSPTAVDLAASGVVALAGEVARYPVTSRTIVAGHPTWLKVLTVIPAASGDFWIRGLGFYVDGLLVAVARYPDTFKPLQVQGAEVNLPIAAILEHTNAEVVFVEGTAGEVFVTNEMLQRALAEQFSWYTLTGY